MWPWAELLTILPMLLCFSLQTKMVQHIRKKHPEFAQIPNTIHAPLATAVISSTPAVLTTDSTTGETVVVRAGGTGDSAGNTQNRSLLVLVTLICLADITLNPLLGHYLRSLLVLSLCGPVLHCQELFISLWSLKDLSFIPNSISSFIQTYWLHIMNSGAHIS